MIHAVLALLMLGLAACQGYSGPIDDPRAPPLPGPVNRMDPLQRGQ